MFTTNPFFHVPVLGSTFGWTRAPVFFLFLIGTMTNTNPVPLLTESEYQQMEREMQKITENMLRKENSAVPVL
jgi:hypothetical protein